MGDTSALMTEIGKMSIKRKNVAQELLETERAYVNSLETLMKVFFIPMNENACGPKSAQVISKDNVRTIFSGLKMILPVNRQLLEELTQRLDVVEEPIIIGDAFESMAFYLKTYKMYCNDYEESRLILAKLKKNPQFEKFFQSLHDTTVIGSATMKDFLIKPIQRIPRYRLLLSEILKYTWESHPDYERLRLALNNISETALDIEAAQEKVFNMNKIISIQNNLVQSKRSARITLLEPGRTFIQEDTLSFKLSGDSENFRKRKFYLFNDLLLVTRCSLEKDPDDRKKRKEHLKLQYTICLEHVNEVVPQDTGNQIQLSTADQQFVFQFAGTKERDHWKEKIEELVSAQKKCISKSPRKTGLNQTLLPGTENSPRSELFRSLSFRRNSTVFSKPPVNASGNSEMVVVKNPLLQHLQAKNAEIRHFPKKRASTNSVDGSKPSVIPQLQAELLKRCASVGSSIPSTVPSGDNSRDIIPDKDEFKDLFVEIPRRKPKFSIGESHSNTVLSTSQKRQMMGRTSSVDNIHKILV